MLKRRCSIWPSPNSTSTRRQADRRVHQLQWAFEILLKLQLDDFALCCILNWEPSDAGRRGRRDTEIRGGYHCYQLTCRPLEEYNFQATFTKRDCGTHNWALLVALIDFALGGYLASSMEGCSTQSGLGLRRWSLQDYDPPKFDATWWVLTSFNGDSRT